MRRTSTGGPAGRPDDTAKSVPSPGWRECTSATGPTSRGDWFVDTRCIDCGTCRDIAPELFAEDSGLSVVRRHPGEAEEHNAWLAAQACPTLSIGSASRRPRPRRLYPREVEPGSGVFDLGYCSENSFGASAWLVVRPAGNVLVDSPRFTEALAGPIAELGGVAHVVFTHRDDVADGRCWAAPRHLGDSDDLHRRLVGLVARMRT